jgi:predicted metallopeptidase
MAKKRNLAKRYPLIVRWPDRLPTRTLTSLRGQQKPAWFEQHSQANPAAVPSEPFDFCHHVQRLVMDIAIRCPEYRHLQVPRILVSVTQARETTLHGLQARVTPLRFHGGALTKPRRGVTYQIQRYFRGDHEYLYVMTFVLPRYLDQEFDQKLVTLFHELHHIGPAFDGDLRRHGGRYTYHSHCQHAYNQQMAALAREYLQSGPDPALFRFLRMTFAQLQAHHGSVTGIVVPRPKIIPLIAPYIGTQSSEPRT